MEKRSVGKGLQMTTTSNFRDYYLLWDEQAKQIFAMTDDIAERSRKIGGKTLRSIGDISNHQRLNALSVEDIPGHSICAVAGALNTDHNRRSVYG
jgi:hypothetical protein